MTSRRERVITEYLSAVSHELRTPLAVIVGYAELIRNRDDEATRREGSDRILEAAERLAAGIENVVALFETGAALGSGAVHPLGPDATEPDRLRNVLLVDDDESVRDLLTITFPEEGFRIVEARGDEVIALATSERPDLVLLDWNLPAQSAADLLRALKAHDGGIPVIVVTVDTDPATRREAQDLGAGAILAKPLSPLQLLATAELLLAAPRG